MSEGGVAVTLAECCFDTGGIGVTVDLPAAAGPARPAAPAGPASDEQALFGESVPVVIVSADPAKADAVVARAQAAGIPARVVGRSGGSEIRIAIAGREALALGVAEEEQAWGTASEARMTGRRAGAA